MNECQSCGAQVRDGWTLCGSCRKTYARTLHHLRVNLHQLHQIAMRRVRLDDHAGLARPAFPSTPISLTMFDLELTARSRIQDTAATIGLWGDGDRLITRMQSRMTDLCRTRSAGRDMHTMIRLADRVAAACERPHALPFCGVCPDCHHDVEADPGTLIVRCECGRIIDAQAMRETTMAAYRLQHITRTPAQAAQWIRENTGITVPRNLVSQWIRRGRVDAVRLEDGYYRFGIGSLLDQTVRHAESLSDGGVTAA